MVPVHDTDVGEERWSKAEWQHYELWERIELRLRRRKWLWIAGTVALFLVLSSIPIVIERQPKWRSMAVARKLAQEINRIKKDASVDHQAYWIRFGTNGTFDYRVERAASCHDTAAPVVIREGIIATPAEGFSLLSSADGTDLGIPGLLTQLCYDPLVDDSPTELRAFGVVPVNDLAEKRGDRVSIVLLRGNAAEASFE